MPCCPLLQNPASARWEQARKDDDDGPAVLLTLLTARFHAFFSPTRPRLAPCLFSICLRADMQLIVDSFVTLLQSISSLGGSKIIKV